MTSPQWSHGIDAVETACQPFICPAQWVSPQWSQGIDAVETPVADAVLTCREWSPQWSHGIDAVETRAAGRCRGLRQLLRRNGATALTPWRPDIVGTDLGASILPQWSHGIDAVETSGTGRPW